MDGLDGYKKLFDRKEHELLDALLSTLHHRLGFRKQITCQLNLENAWDHLLNANQILSSRKTAYFNKRNTQETKGALICFYLGLTQNLPIELHGFKVLRKGDHTEPSCFTACQQDQVPITSELYSQMMGSSTAGTSFARGADTAGSVFSSTAASFAAANDTSFDPDVGAESKFAAPAPPIFGSTTAPAPPSIFGSTGANLFGGSTTAIGTSSDPPAPAPPIFGSTAGTSTTASGAIAPAPAPGFAFE